MPFLSLLFILTFTTNQPRVDLKLSGSENTILGSTKSYEYKAPLYRVTQDGEGNVTGRNLIGGYYTEYNNNVTQPGQYAPSGKQLVVNFTTGFPHFGFRDWP